MMIEEAEESKQDQGVEAKFQQQAEAEAVVEVERRAIWVEEQ